MAMEEDEFDLESAFDEVLDNPMAAIWVIGMMMIDIYDCYIASRVYI